jgi:hypothetical protein
MVVQMKAAQIVEVCDVIDTYWEGRLIFNAVR